MNLRTLGLTITALGITACTSVAKQDAALIDDQLSAMVNTSSEGLVARLGAPKYVVDLADDKTAYVWDTYKLKVEDFKITPAIRGQRLPYSASMESGEGCTILVVLDQMKNIEKWEYRQGKTGCAEYKDKLI